MNMELTRKIIPWSFVNLEKELAKTNSLVAKIFDFIKNLFG